MGRVAVWGVSGRLGEWQKREPEGGRPGQPVKRVQLTSKNEANLSRFWKIDKILKATDQDTEVNR